ncbi:MAG TPA: prolyl oligopeptidase family serine peptidase [Armatimonadota bacterium]
MHRILAVSLVTACAALATSAYAAPKETGFLSKTLSWKGKDVRYVLFVPPGYTPSKAWPTIVSLNGAGECGTDGMKHIAVGLGSAIQWNVDAWPFLVLLPQKPTVQSAWEDHDELVMAMLDRTRKDYKVDAKRICLTGLSQGGHGTWALGALHPDLFAAIVPICGWGDPKTAAKLAKTPLWAFHGEADNAVPLSGSVSMVDAVKAAGGSPKLTTYPGVGHNSWDNAYRQEKLNEWLLQQSLPSK